jgi:hypothetical protein
MDFDLPRPEFIPYPLPLVSRFKAKPELEALPESLLHTSSIRINSSISSYLSLLFPTEFLTTILMAS